MVWSNRVQTKEFNLPSNVSSGAEIQDFGKRPAFTRVHKLCYMHTIPEFRLCLRLGIVQTTKRENKESSFFPAFTKSNFQFDTFWNISHRDENKPLFSLDFCYEVSQQC